MHSKLWPKSPAKEGTLGQMSTNFQVYFIGGALAIFRLRIFLNYFSQKFEKIKITVWKSDNLTMYGHFF